jgi:hypothetical protein
MPPPSIWPSSHLYFGIDLASFYGALGWGNTALAMGLIIYWSAAVAIAAMRAALTIFGR